MFDVVIIGSGPAGLTAAIYGRRAGLSVLVLEKAPMSGGQLINTYEVDNYPGLQGMSGFDMGMKFREHAESMEAEFAEGEVLEIRLHGETKEVVTKNHVYEARAIIIAAGATHSRLDVPGEEELRGRGVSYCATCDGAFFREKDVAVVGGGDVAVEDAIFLARLCRKVYVIHRRDTFRAAGSLSKRLMELPNVEIVWDTVVEEICGNDQGNKVAGILTFNKKTGERQTIAVDGVFLAVGILPNTERFKGLLELDKGGYIQADETGSTSEPGMFAAGDVRTKALRQIITAAADGANVIASIERYLA